VPDISFWAGPVTQPYGYTGNPAYTIRPGWHIGVDIGSYGELVDVGALVDGVVVRSHQSSQIGRTVVLDVADTFGGHWRYLSVSHMYYGDAVPAGTPVTRGERLGRLAGAGDSPGWSWGGVHGHVVLSTVPDGAYSGGAAEYTDPMPFIRGALAGAAWGSSSPFNPSAALEAEMYIIEAPDRTPALIGPGYFRPLNTEELGNVGAIVSKRTTVNARQYDLCVSVATTGQVSAPAIGATLIKSPNRPLALVDAGFFRVFNTDEEAQQAGYFATRRFEVNDRQYDLARSIAVA
jgi:hypothetical protein